MSPPIDARPRRGRSPVGPGLAVVLVLLLASWAWDRSDVGARLSGSAEAGPGYRFEDISPGTGTGVTFDPCQAIPVVLNPAGGPRDAEDLVADAVERTAEASGFDLVYAGPTAEGLGSRMPGGTAPVLVVFADAAAHAALADAVGTAQRIYARGADGHVSAVSGEIVLGIEEFTDRGVLGLVGGNSEEYLEGVVMHELGHLIGLDHVSDPTQLMYTSGNESGDFGEGDLAGLRVLRQTTCRSG